MRRLLPYALFAILVCIFLWKPIFLGKALLPGDYLAQMEPWKSVLKAPDPPPQWNPLQWDAISQFYPWRVFYARSMSQGHIPLWNPYQFSGTPFLANGQSAVLYPLNLLFLVFDPITGFTVFAALHLFLAQVFMYWLMRELGAKELGAIVAAIVFAFSAFMVLWLELPTFVSAAVWLPLVLLLIHRAVEQRSFFYGMLSGVGIAMAVLAGHSQIAFYVGLAAMLWWLWKLAAIWRAEGKINTFLKVVVPLCGCVLTAGLISAPQVLPTQELATNSHRVRQVTPEGYARFVGNSVKPYHLITAFIPDFYGNPSKNNYLGGSAADYIEYGMYCGILPLMLALIGLGSIREKHVGYFVSLILLALLTATGTPINRLFYFWIPGFSALGGPNRILLLYLFGVAAMAGIGVEWFISFAEEKITGGRIKIRAGEAAAGVALVVLVAAYESAWGPTDNILRWMTKFSAAYLQQGRVLIVYALVFACICLFVARARELIGRSAFGLLAVAVVIADLFAFGINYNPTCDRAKVYPDTPLTKKLQQLTKHGERIAPINPSWSLFRTPKAILPPNSAMVYGLYDVQGYDSLYTRAYKDFSSKIQGEDSSPVENGNMVLWRKPSEFILGAYYVSEHQLHMDTLYPAQGVQADGVWIYSSNVASHSACRTANPWPAFEGIRRTGRADGEWNNHRAIWLGPNKVNLGLWPLCTSRTIDPATDRVLEIHKAFAPYLCLESVPYPGWVARSGRTSLEVSPQGEFIRIYWPKVHLNRPVVLSFEPFTFRLGLFLMLVGVGALTGVGAYRCLRARKAK